jgi:hypothetical protein
LESLDGDGSADTFGGVNQPAEAAKHVDKHVCVRQRLPGGGSAKDDVVQILEDAQPVEQLSK